jgi:hypothetical protein
MSFRHWRPRRILGISLLWMLSLWAVAVVRGGILWARQIRQENQGADLYVIVHTPGGAWALLGPPLLLLAAWRWARQSRTVS